MIVVADTMPIITLMKLQRLDLLEKLFGAVIIPNAVYAELISNPKYLTEAQMVVERAWIRHSLRQRMLRLTSQQIQQSPLKPNPPPNPLLSGKIIRHDCAAR